MAKNFPVDTAQIFYDMKNEGTTTTAFNKEDKGYDYYIESITINAYCVDGLPIEMTYQIGDKTQFSVDMYREIIINSGTTVTVPVNQNIKGGRYDLKFAKSLTAINTGRTIVDRSFVSGWKVPMISNFTEKNVILCLGDSIDVLSSYVTRTIGHRNYTMLNNLRESGFDCRLASVAISGKSLSQFVEYFKQGLFKIRKADILLVQHGANDIGQSVSNAAFLANLNYMKSYRNANYPTAKLVIVKVVPSNATGAYATDGTARNLVQAGYNTQIDNFVSANSGNNIYSIDCFTSFPQVSTNWADGVHLTQAGHDLAGDLLTIGMKTILGL